MTPVTQAHIKNISGYSKQLISKDVAAGKFTMCEHGGKKMIDMDGHLTVQWIELHPTKSPDDPPPEPIIKATPDKSKSQSRNPSGKAPHLTKKEKDLKEEKLLEDIEKVRIHNQQKRGDLIEKKLVELLFGKIYQIDVDQIKPLGIDLTPKLIGILNDQNKRKTKELAELLEISKADEIKQIESILNSGEPELKTKIVAVCEDTSGGILKNVQSEIDNFFTVLEREE